MLEKWTGKNKMSGKEQFDKNNHAKESEIEIGDKVVVEQEKTNKLTPRFNPTSWLVIDKKGPELTLKDNEGKVMKRATAMVKKLIVHEEMIKDSEVIQESEVEEKEAQPVEMNSETRTTAEDGQLRTRHGRIVRPPIKASMNIQGDSPPKKKKKSNWIDNSGVCRS